MCARKLLGIVLLGLFVLGGFSVSTAGSRPPCSPIPILLPPIEENPPDPPKADPWADNARRIVLPEVKSLNLIGNIPAVFDTEAERVTPSKAKPGRGK